MKATTTKKSAGRKSAKKANAVTSQPFLPYHIAAIAWIFLPGGGVPATTADVPGLDQQIQMQNPTPQARVRITALLNSVFAELQLFLGDTDLSKQFVTGRTDFQTLLAKMNNLWDGKDSNITADLVAQIASIS